MNTLISVVATTVRPNTARAAAYAALVNSLGATRAECLAAVREAETAWHVANGRTPKGINPGGWLRLFGAVFETPATETPAPVAEPTIKPTKAPKAPKAKPAKAPKAAKAA